MGSLALNHTKRLLEVMQKLRDPEHGCAWDCKQTMKTLIPYTIEEAYEVADAIYRGDYNLIKDELGDLLFQVVFYAQIATEEKRFSFDDIAEQIFTKLERRHPHVFGDLKGKYLTDGELAEQWNAIKQQEKRSTNTGDDDNQSIFDDLASGRPAMTRAIELQRACQKVGFDWQEVSPVIDKIREEVDELEHELTVAGNQQKIEEEFGDLLFATMNVARHLNIDPEIALIKANLKFESRFKQIEAKVSRQKKSLEDYSLEELELMWQWAKNQDHK